MSSPQPPVTRRYLTDAAYTADAAAMTAAGWRVISISRDASGAIVTIYAPPGMPTGAPARGLALLNRRMFFVGAGVGGLLILVAVAALLVTNLSPSAAAPGIAAATQTASAYTAALDATSTAVVNATPLPTARPQPTATPAPTFTPVQVYDAIAQANCNFLTASVTTSWDAAHATVSVTAQVGPQWDVSALHTTVENIVFDCFKSFYTSPQASAVQWVDVVVKGPVTDAYGNNTIGIYGEADLSRVTARPFNWANLDYLQAWNNDIYDSQWERNS